MYFTKDPTRASSGASAENPHAKLVLTKPFVVPKVKQQIERVQPQRKRKRVDYKNQGGDNDDSDDDEARKKKKRKDDREALADAVNNVKLGKVEEKAFPQLARQKFAIPTMRDKKTGIVIPTVMTYSALGIRPLTKIPPRPLHDPMADHAIVLYDPTIDMTETDEERKERLLAAAKDALRKEDEARVGSLNLPNPHKSLRELLGISEEAKKAKELLMSKVPVVIDPIIGSKLRPHQIEGVKVCTFQCQSYIHQHISIHL